jgi:hypothetical protein
VINFSQAHQVFELIINESARTTENSLIKERRKEVSRFLPFSKSGLPKN